MLEFQHAPHEELDRITNLESWEEAQNILHLGSHMGSHLIPNPHKNEAWDQDRLVSTIDLKEGTLKMVVLEPIVAEGKKTPSNFKTI